MKTEEMTIDPTMAAAILLRSSGKNFRKLNKSLVATYAHSMTSGVWQKTHQGIAIHRGACIDGQHRLAAIVKSGVSCTLMVTTYSDDEVPPDMIDRGSARTIAQILASRGCKNANDVSAIARAAVAPAGNRCVQPQEIIDMVAKNYDAIIEMRHAGWGISTAPASVVGCALAGVLSGNVSMAVAVKFLQSYSQEVNDGGCPTAALRRYVARRTRTTDQWHVTCAAIKLFRDGKKRKTAMSECQDTWPTA